MAVQAAQLSAKISIEGADSAKSQLTGVGQSTDSLATKLKNSLGQAFSFVAGLAGQAIQFLGGQFVDSLKDAASFQDIINQTNDVLKSTHDASGMTASAIEGLARSLSTTTYFSDSAIESGENLLLTFTGIGKDIFPQVTQTALDMAKSLGEDTTSAAMQLGKALNDPAQGLQMLQREGVTFSDSQKKMIQQMVASGDTVGAQKLMLAELQKEFGGSSDATKTFSGQMAILGNTIDDAKQHLGMAFLPILGQVATTVTSFINPALDGFAKFLQSSAFQSFASGVGKTIGDDLQSIGDFAKNNVVPAIGDVVGVIQSPQFATFAEQLGDLGGTVKNIVTSAFKDARPVIGDLFGFVQTQALPALSHLAENLNTVTKGMREHKDVILSVAAALGIAFIPSIIKTGVEAVIAGVKVSANFVASIVQSGLSGYEAAAKVAVYVAGLVATGAQAIWAGAQVAASFIVSIVKAGVEAAATGAIFVAKLIPGLVSVVAESIVAAATAIPGLIAGLVGAAGAAWGFTAALLANPITWIVLAIVGLIAVIVLLATHWSQVTAAIGAALSWLGDHVHQVMDAIGGKIHDIVGGVGQAFQDLGGKIHDIWDGIWGDIKGALNWVIGGIDSFLSGLDSIHVTLPNGTTLGFNIPLIPKLATGGLIASAGMAIVGERGPEAVWLPTGAQVIPNNQIQSGNFFATPGSQQQQPMKVDVYLDGNRMSAALMPGIVQQIRIATGAKF